MKGERLLHGLAAFALLSLLGFAALLLQGGAEVVRAMRPPTDETTPKAARRFVSSGEGLRLRLVDASGAGLPGLQVTATPCEAGVAVSGRAGPEGRLLLEGLDGCVRLALDEDEARLVGPTQLFAGGPELSVLVDRLCPGWVTIEGAPPDSILWLGRADYQFLPADGRLFVADRRCGVGSVRVDGGGALFELGEVDIRGEEPLHLACGEGVFPPEPWTVDVVLEGDNLPQHLWSLHQRCTGGPDRWQCRCPAAETCSIEAGWEEALFDWRVLRVELGEALPGQSTFHHRLFDGEIEATGQWVGPLPCWGFATEGVSRAHRSVACEEDGQFAIPGLFPGDWTLSIGWAPEGRPLVPLTRRFRVTEADGEIDLGRLGLP